MTELASVFERQLAADYDDTEEVPAKPDDYGDEQEEAELP